MLTPHTIKNYLTVDVEDYFQVSAFSNVVKFDNWKDYEYRVVNNTKKLLETLHRAGNIKATFFILGWVAEKSPELVKEIAANGHEIACHSYSHKLIYNLTEDAFRKDTIKARDILEDITGKAVVGYRAPSYSITKRSSWAFRIIKEAGFKYDSSVFPILHDRYGVSDAPRFKYMVPDCDIIEYPISTSEIFGLRLPVSGGGYFRLLPYSLTKCALSRINKAEKLPFMFYIHPWEIDPEQPRINGAGFLSNFRHYVNLKKTMGRFEQLIQDFQFGSIFKGSTKFNESTNEVYSVSGFG